MLTARAVAVLVAMSAALPALAAPKPEQPKVVIAVRDGWSFSNGFAVLNTSRQIFVTIWDGVDVYANGCHWLGP